MEFKDRLRKLRKEAKETQSALAKAIQISLNQVARFEKGEQKPGFDNLRNIADFYGVSVDWLMGRTERREVWP